MKKIVLVVSSFLMLGISFTSCKKGNKEVDNETQSLVDNALCEQEFMRVGPAVSERAVSTQGVKRMMEGFAYKVFAACPTDTLTGDTLADANGNFINTTNLPSITLDWGVGCIDPTDGVTRSGKIKSTFNKKYGTVGSQVTVQMINYKVNGITYSGSMRITRLAAGTNSSFRTEVIDGHCSNGTWNIDWATDKTVTWIAGYDTQTTADDVIEITGTSTGKNREGRAFTVNIKNALEKRSKYKYIVKGTLEITPEGLKVRTVDFGDGAEDNVATFIVNGNTFTFTMQ